MTRAAIATQWRRLPHPLRWVGAAIGGGAGGLARPVLLVVPRPPLPLLILGLLILATEFVCAETLLQHVKRRSASMASTVSDRLGARRRRTP